MDAELKQDWIEALESGEYTKARGTLLTNNGKNKCCLAVLAIVVSQKVRNDYSRMSSLDIEAAYNTYVNSGCVQSPFKDGEESRIIHQNDYFPGYPIQWIKDNL